jgi:hypothetical protein
MATRKKLVKRKDDVLEHYHVKIVEPVDPQAAPTGIPAGTQPPFTPATDTASVSDAYESFTSIADRSETAAAEREQLIAVARTADEQIAAAWDSYWAVAGPMHDKLKQAADEDGRARRGWASSAARSERLRAEAEALRPQADSLRAAAVTLDQKLYTGWNRFFLVQHIHRSTACSTLRPTTRVGWLPNVSGLTEEEAVQEYQTALCTVCFPSAPVFTPPAVDGACPGAGKYLSSAPSKRTGFAAGNWAECPECGKRVGITRSSMRIPKHKTP